MVGGRRCFQQVRQLVVFGQEEPLGYEEEYVGPETLMWTVTSEADISDCMYFN